MESSGRIFINASIATSRNAVFASRRAFDDGLPERQRAAVLAAARAAEARMTARGVQVVPASPELRAAIRRVGETMVEESAQRAGEDGRRMLAEYRAARG